MKSNYSFRKANSGDVDFLSLAILSSEKSMTKKLGLANLFEISEKNLKEYIVLMLNEGIEGCEFSIDSFLLACENDEPIATIGGWIEGAQDGMSSALIKSSLMSFVFPKENMIKAKEKIAAFKGLQIKRNNNTFQLEYAFVNEKHQGNYLINQLIYEHIKLLQIENHNIKKIQTQVYGHHKVMILTYKLSDFCIKKTYQSDHEDTLLFLPHNTKLLLEKDL